jgi:hypothetical protein
VKKPNQHMDEFERFEQLRNSIVAQRREFLKKFNHDELLDYTSHQDIKNWLLEIYQKKTRGIAPDTGGMKTNPKAIWTKKNVPKAILAICNRKETVTNESIKDELDKLTDSIDPTDPKKQRKMYSENGIKTALAEFNRDTEKWLIDNKQLEDI